MTILDHLSFQLYSARFMGGLEQQFELLAALGYSKVEPYGGLFRRPAPEEIADEVRYDRTRPPMWAWTAGGRMRSARQDVPGPRDRLVFAPAPPMGERDKDAEGWRTLGRELAEFGKAAEAEGLRFGWHNHHWEYGKAPDGRTFLELIFAEAPDLLFEFDVAWAIRGGADPGTKSRNTPAGSWPATSRTWPRLANAWTRMAGRTPATAQWAGRICRDD